MLRKGFISSSIKKTISLKWLITGEKKTATKHWQHVCRCLWEISILCQHDCHPFRFPTSAEISAFELPRNRMMVAGGDTCVSLKWNVDLDKLPSVPLQHLGVNDPRKLQSIILRSPANRKHLPVNSFVLFLLDI